MVPALDDGNMYREPLWLPLNSSVHFPVNHDWMEHLPEWGYGVFFSVPFIVILPSKERTYDL